MRRYDLHVHTSWSDGSTTVNNVIEYSAKIGLGGIALCDHDSMDMVPIAEEMAAGRSIEIIPAVELSTRDNVTGKKVHILVYMPQDIAPLQGIFDDMNKKRRIAGQIMIEKVAALYPVTEKMVLNYSMNSSTIFRVHIMRALMELGYDDRMYGRLYKELFADPAGSCWVSVEYTDMMKAVYAARESGGIVAVAHPCVYDSFESIERLAKDGLIDAIEHDYPRCGEKSSQRQEKLASEYGLLKTAGTDYHGFYSSNPHSLGSCTVDEKIIDEMKKMITLKAKK